MLDTNEIKEKLQEFLEKNTDIGDSLEAKIAFLKKIKEIDSYGFCEEMYIDISSEIINGIDFNTPLAVDVWNSLNLVLQKRNNKILENVFDAINKNPERSLEVWNSTFEKMYLLQKPDFVEEVLKLTREQEEEITLQTYSVVFLHAYDIFPKLNINTINEGFEILNHKDAWLTVYSLNGVPKEYREQVISNLDIPWIKEGYKEELLKEDDSNVLVEYYRVLKEAKLPGIDLSEYKTIIEEKLKSDPKKALEEFKMHYFNNISAFKTTIIELLCIANKEGMDISDYLTSFTLTPSEIEEVLNKVDLKDIPKEIKIQINIKNLSEFSKEKLEKIRGHIEKVNLGQDSYVKLEYEEVEATRDVVDEILKDIDFGEENDPNREMKIYKQIIKKLAKRIKYNYKALWKEKKSQKLRKKISDNKQLSDEKKEKIREKIGSLDTEVAKSHIRNSYGALVLGKVVCAGYAVAVKNVFACAGIEARKISGTPEKGKVGHAWNQIKIDGIWYNLDLTWDRDLLNLGYPPGWILKSDEEFKDHDMFVKHKHQQVEKCETSVRKKELNKYVIHGFRTIEGNFKKPNKIRNWLKQSLRSVNLKDVDNALERLEKDVSNMHDKSKEQLEI